MSHALRRRPRRLALVTAAAVAGGALSLVPGGSAHALPTGSASGGTATWGLSTYLNSANIGRPNPLASGYVAPASFDATSRISTWGAATGTVNPDGSAVLAFDGTSVNFAATSGAWLKLTDLEATLDASGNGSVSAIVQYGLAPGTFPNITYDPAQAPVRGPARVELVDLAANTVADIALTATDATYTGLDGTWAPELVDFLDGDASADPAIPGFVYAGQVNSNADRTPLPFTFDVDRVTPTATAQVTSASYGDGATVEVAGSGFSPTDGNPGDAGVYIGLAPSGGLPPVDTMEGMDAFAGASWVPAASIVDGAFTASLTAPTDKLDPEETYSVYTWRAHGHSTTSQDTETPVEIDWTALAPLESTTVVGGPTSKTYGAAATLTATVPGPGSVTLTGLGTSTTADVVDGVATFAVPATLATGSYDAVLAYSGGGDYLASQATRAFSVTRATPALKATWTKKPTAKKAGKLAVALTGPATVAAPTGKVSALLKKGGKTVKVAAKALASGKVVLAVKKLPAGSWRATVSYLGAGGFAATSRTITVKVAKK